MVILAIRALIDHIFRSNYPKFYEVQRHDLILSKLINDVITIILDPNLFYSRFSFIESEKDSMNVTFNKFRASKLPKINSKLFTRSALMKSLFPVPTEGKIRAMFLNDSQERLRCKSTIPWRRDTNITKNEGESSKSKINTSLTMFREKKLAYLRSKHNISASSIKTDHSYKILRSKTSLGDQRNEYDDTFNTINKVKMLQLAVSKANRHMMARNKSPIFKIRNE